jgi:hypothetical protein
MITGIKPMGIVQDNSPGSSYERKILALQGGIPTLQPGHILSHQLVEKNGEWYYVYCNQNTGDGDNGYHVYGKIGNDQQLARWIRGNGGTRDLTAMRVNADAFLNKRFEPVGDQAFGTVILKPRTS